MLGWHGDGTASERDRASHLIVPAQARPIGEARPGRHEPGWQAAVGSAGLVQTLNQHQLVEYRLLVFPVVIGTGKRLFGDGTVPTGFKTVENRTTSTGVVALTLRTTGTPPKGEVGESPI